MTTSTVNLHAWQARLVLSDANHRVVEAARRGGKSRGAFHALEKDISEKMPQPVPSYQQPPYHAWIVVPNFPQSNQVWTELMAFIPEEHMAAPPNQEYKRITLKGAPGGRAWGLIEVKSAHDPQSLQTAGLDFLWVSEAQDISNASFERMSPMLHSPERPLKAIWEGIPALWRDHWFWRICEAAQRGDRGYEYFHWTFYENPLLTQEQIEDIEQERDVLTEAAWRRMYLAERTESAGFFKNIDAAIGGDMLTGPLPGRRYVGGLDLGRKIDATVLWILDQEERKGVYHQTWDAGEDWATQRDGVVHACERFGVGRLHVDATGMGGDMFSQSLSALGVPVEDYIFTEPTRLHLLNTLAVALERSTTTFPHVDAFIRQLRGYQFIKRGNGKPRPDHPEGEHDDEIMGYGLGLLLCDEGSPELPHSVNAVRKRSYFPTRTSTSLGHMMQRNAIAERRRQRIERSGIVLP